MVWSARQAPGLIKTRLSQLMVMAALLTVGGPAWALIIQIDSITSVPGLTYTPNARLGVLSASATDANVAHVINIEDCKGILKNAAPKVRITWSWLDHPLIVPSSATYGIKIAAPGASCSSTEMSSTADPTGKCKVLITDQKFNNPNTANGEVVDIDLRDVLGDTVCTAGTEPTAKIYFLIGGQTSTVGATATTSGITLDIKLDLAGPGAPTITGLSPGGSNLKVTWTYVDEKANNAARVYWSAAPLDLNNLGAASSSAKLTGTSYQIGGLTNGTPYNVTVVSVDSHDNESAPAAIKTAAPIQVQDIWQFYKANGGAEEGNYAACNASPVGSSRAGLLAVLLLAGGAVWLGRRRKSLRSLAIVLVAGGLIIALPGRSEAASPLTSSLDIRFGSYTPQVDREFASTNKATPYATLMNDGAWEIGATLDWRIWHAFGEFSMGMGAARWTKEGQSLTLTGATTADTTSLSIVPISIDAVYRFDVLAERYDFPLIPYVRGGVVYALWWMENGLGNLSRTTIGGTEYVGRGGTGGFYGTVGLRLLLDVFEPQSARSFDIEMGVNHSYLFAEYKKLSLTDFGNPKSIDLSDDVLNFGLAFDL